ncbi:Peptidoglycan-binding (PGRP) domain of peptidoglycan hydrolases-containing protein [Methylobacterium sp. ap11]|uniref:peptidoglycan-binding domain-containing protein n=1 Tax=Methylobacterium sp. ap11 TaxID=1761799 RepID=UPI0008CF0A39|nr:peptidoglycan-binding domain-containing protein [Methylobacterium sp. ap11]SEP44922.1 Peptidoglycan-binding (PGRP) domain of peptidoglycan hydrolases-containing protein [Methylobacterium sp. ap11]
MPRPARLLAAGLLPLLAGGISIAHAQAPLPGGAHSAGVPAVGAPAAGTPAAKAPAPRPAGPTAPDPAFEAARAAFEARPEAERRAVQDALVWAGSYNSVVTGSFGRRTYEAIGAWQARGGAASATGILDEAGRAALLAAGEAARKAARFTVAADSATGLVLGVPERLLSKRSRIAGGTRWQSPDGRVTLDTRAYAAGEADLDTLHAQAAAATPERKVTYSLKRPDFTVVTGETPTGKFYIRTAAGAAGLRGFTLSYDKGSAREMDRLVIAIANSFVPFPGEAAPPPPRPMAATAQDPGAKGPAPAAPAAPGSVAATGIVVGPRRVVAVLPAACSAPRIAGEPARILRRDEAAGLVLLEGHAPASAALVLAAAPPRPEEAVVVVAAGAEGPTVTTGEIAAGGVLAPLQPGAAGAPILDRAGRLLGLVARLPAQPRLVAGIVPPLTHPLVGTAALKALLGAEAPASPAGDAKPLTAGAIAGRVAGAVVALRCGP